MFRVGAEDFLHKHTSSARELSVIRLAMAGAADLVLVRREPEGMLSFQIEASFLLTRPKPAVRMQR